MKKSELFFLFILIPIDFCALLLAGMSAYYLRLAPFVRTIRPVIFDIPVNDYFAVLSLVALWWLVIFAFSGLYRSKYYYSFAQEAGKIVMASLTGLAFIAILIFLRHELFNSRFIVLAGCVFAVLYLLIFHGIVRIIQSYLKGFGVGVRKVVIVGNGRAADILAEEFSFNKKASFLVIKRFRDFNLETSQELAEFMKTSEVDEIIQADPNLSKAEIIRLYDFTDEYHIGFRYAADLLDTKTLKTEVREIAGIPLVEVRKTMLDGWGRIAKRIFDIVLSIFFIILFSPIMILTVLAVKLDSAGPIIYKNKRVGKGGKLFKTLKFRSMKIYLCTGDEYGSREAEDFEKKLVDSQNTKEGPVYKIGDDPRLTRVGKFIRRWSLDELPQFFNVLFGDMSIVGPRPHQPREVAKYEHHHKKVLEIKPGITGLAQVSGRSDLSFEEEVRLDTYYIENWSLFFDLAIILKTPLAMLKKRKAE